MPAITTSGMPATSRFDTDAWYSGRRRYGKEIADRPISTCVISCASVAYTITWKKFFAMYTAQAYAAIDPATVITVAISGTPRLVTAATAFGAMPSNDHANSVRGGCSIVSAMITGQKRTNVSTMKIANAVLFTNADDRKKYAAELPSSDGSPPPLAAVRKSFPKP